MSFARPLPGAGAIGPIGLVLKALLVPLLLALLTGRCLAGTSGIAVIYPDLGEPYRSFFAGIIQGIEDKAKGRTTLFPVGQSTDAAELGGHLHRQEFKVAIALGRQGLRAASGLDREVGVVVGGILSAPEAESRAFAGISLSPDPALLFSRLKRLTPAVRKVHVVYDPKYNEWLMRFAREAARSQNLELATYEAHDLRSAARLYQEILAASDSKRDALWLAQDATTVEESVVLPLVLREAWDRNLIVFSSTFGHVKRGVLFSLYPDSVELGRSLGSAALSYLNGGTSSRSIQPLREVLMAVNLRTAGHIGLNISYQQQRSFDFVFPEP